MRDTLTRFRSGVTAKVLLIGVLGLVLLVPMGLVRELILERSGRLEAVRAEVATGWGAAQTIGAAMLVIPFTYIEQIGDETRRLRDTLYVLPRSLSVDVEIAPSTLQRGIYDVPVYSAAISIRGTLGPPRMERTYAELELLWNEAEIVLPLSDPRPLTAPIRVHLADGEAELEAAGRGDCPPPPAAAMPLQRLGPFGPLAIGEAMMLSPVPQLLRRCGPGGARLSAPLRAFGLDALAAAQSFSLELTLRGTERLHFLPLGDTTTVEMRSPWPSPSFGGAFLPIAREVGRGGFTAEWNVLALGRGYPSTFTGSSGLEAAIDSTSFGVELMPAHGVHESTLRAAKYAVLFIALTFMAYFLFEVFGRLRLHALHYLSVGAANCTFFLLLLAVGEHIGFGIAYALSAAASILLIAAYSAAVLRTGRRAAVVSALLGAIYAYLYVTLKAEDYALLIGALGMFAALAAFMLLTRHVDWNALGETASSGDEPA